jgi:hypothetical protein
MTTSFFSPVSWNTIICHDRLGTSATKQIERRRVFPLSRYVLKKASAQGWQTSKPKKQQAAAAGGGEPDEEEHDALLAAAEAAAGNSMLPGQEDAEAAEAAAEQAKAEENEPISAEVVKQRAERKLLYQEARRYARRHGGNSEGGAGGPAAAGGSGGGGGGGIIDEEEPDGSSPSFDAHFGVHAAPHILVHSLGTRWRSERLLDSVKPVYVVMYDPDASFVRCLEVFKAMHPGRPLRVYFLTYQDSVRN